MNGRLSVHEKSVAKRRWPLEAGFTVSFERQGTTRNNPVMRRWCNRCNQSSDDAEYVKDEVYRCFAVWSITSCWSNVTDDALIYQRLHQWTFSARQVRSDLDVFLTRLTPGTFTLQLFSVYVAFIKYWELASHCARIVNSCRQYTLTKPACEAPMHTRCWGFQIAKFTFRLSVVFDEEWMETKIECTKMEFSTWDYSYAMCI